jgi:hypothetical protein
LDRLEAALELVVDFSVGPFALELGTIVIHYTLSGRIYWDWHFRLWLIIAFDTRLASMFAHLCGEGRYVVDLVIDKVVDVTDFLVSG